MKKRAYPQDTLGSIWAMDTAHGCWAVVLCVGDRRAAVGNYPCLMLACSTLGWSSPKSRPGSIINVALGGALAWKRVV